MRETQKQQPVAQIGMLIRKPIADVFQAFVDPQVTSRFWFTHGSGELRQGETITWTWGMYGVSDQITVTELVQNQRIAITWNGPETPNQVVWTFTEIPGKGTYVDIVNSGFAGSADEQCAAALDSTGGFTLVMAGAKAWLEHGIELNLVGDRFPAEMGESS